MPVSDQGANRERYMLIPRVLIFLRRGNRVLLLKGSPTKRLWANRFNGLGGHIEAGEDVLSAARRELEEEAGLFMPCPSSGSMSAESGCEDTAGDLWLCGTILVDTKDNPGIGIFIFTGECPTGEPSESSEGTLHWVDLDDIPNLPVVEDLPCLLERIKQMKRGDPPFSGRSFYNSAGQQVVEIFG